MTPRLNHPGGQAQKNFREEGGGEGQGEGGRGKERKAAGGRVGGWVGPGPPCPALRCAAPEGAVVRPHRVTPRACARVAVCARVSPRAPPCAGARGLVRVRPRCARVSARLTRHAPARLRRRARPSRCAPRGGSGGRAPNGRAGRRLRGSRTFSRRNPAGSARLEFS